MRMKLYIQKKRKREQSLSLFHIWIDFRQREKLMERKRARESQESRNFASYLTFSFFSDDDYYHRKMMAVFDKIYSQKKYISFGITDILFFFGLHSSLRFSCKFVFVVVVWIDLFSFSYNNNNNNYYGNIENKKKASNIFQSSI